MLPENIFHRVAPVGNPIGLRANQTLPALMDDARIRFVQSGTAALAAAIQVAKLAKPNIAKPEVIIPAYCCPDVVAAINYNDCIPVLVDFIADRPHMDLQALVAAITPQTIAVVAVNFLGMPERCSQIREITAPHNIVLIEDSAQWFPEQGNLFENFHGDLAILSFGKGKPISLLGGGAIICRNPELPFDALRINPPLQQRPAWQLLLLFAVYDLVIHPLFYWLLELVPFIEMGVTKYKPLTTIAGIDPTKLGFLQENIRRYRLRKSLRYRSTIIATNSIDAEYPLRDTYTQLRHAVLAATEERRNTIVAEANKLGLGASTLYGRPLTALADVPLKIRPAAPNAENFARRLITLPTHRYVSARQQSAIESLPWN